MLARYGRAFIISVVLALLAPAAWAQALSPGERTVALVTQDGNRLPIGRLSLKPVEGTGLAIALKLDAPEFKDEFLSMRPFRCLTQAREMWCHLPYPYDSKGRITEGDLVDLEYALLFLFKPPAAYGIDAWNGLYFKLAVEPDGTIAGDAHEVNLDVLATPPEDRSARLIGHGDLTPVGSGAHAFRRIEIK